MPQEVAHIEQILDTLAEQLNFDLAAWEQLPLTEFTLETPDTSEYINPQTNLPWLQGKTIAVARDAAFAFIYPANLDCLRALGAHLMFFPLWRIKRSPI